MENANTAQPANDRTPATPEEIAAARDIYSDFAEIDDDALASRTPTGVWVQAWVFVNNA